MIDCSICGWRHTVPCGRDDCPHDAATHFAAISTALDNAVANGCMEELSKMSDEDIAYDLARLDAGCERLPIEIIKAGVRAWRVPQPDDQQARIYEEISEVEHWIGGMPGQKAGLPRLRGLREAAAMLLTRITTLEQENADHKTMRLAHHMQDKRLGIAADHMGHFHNARAEAAEARAEAAERRFEIAEEGRLSALRHCVRLEKQIQAREGTTPPTASPVRDAGEGEQAEGTRE